MMCMKHVQAEVKVTIYKGSDNLEVARIVLCGCAGQRSESLEETNGHRNARGMSNIISRK